MTSALSNVGLSERLGVPGNTRVAPPSSILRPSVISQSQCYFPLSEDTSIALLKTHSTLRKDFHTSCRPSIAEPQRNTPSDSTSVPCPWRYRYLCEPSVFLTCRSRRTACSISSKRPQEPQSCFIYHSSLRVQHYRLTCLLCAMACCMCMTLHGRLSSSVLNAFSATKLLPEGAWIIQLYCTCNSSA